MPLTDHQLLLAMHKGHEPSARLLWERLGRRLVAYARTLVRHEQAAEDAVQGALLRVMSARADQVRSVDNPLAWLILLTRREAAAQWRTHRRDLSRQARSGRSERWLSVEPTADASIAEAVDSLPRRQREVVVLKHIAGLTFDQIAFALDLNRNTAAARYRAGLAALRAALTPPAEPPARSGGWAAGEGLEDDEQSGCVLREVRHG